MNKPKHTLEELLLKTVEGRKATPEERARALASAFHRYCFQHGRIIHLGSFDLPREILPPTPVEDEKCES